MTITQLSFGFSAWLPATKYIECGKSLRLDPKSSTITSKLKHGKPSNYKNIVNISTHSQVNYCEKVKY